MTTPGAVDAPLTDPARRPTRIAMVAGEASGDQLGAGLIRELAQRLPHAEFAGIGGERMRAEGFDAWWPSDALAVMGLAEVISHLPRLLRLRSRLAQRVRAWKPDLFIGIDAPDFNLSLERGLKSRGLRTIHYVSPSVWAWRPQRAARIGRSADRVLCLFPMEPAIYAAHGVQAIFVGHPLADKVPLDPHREDARALLGLGAHLQVLALLPGSRAGEIKRLAPILLDAAALLLQRHPRWTVIAPMAGAACRNQFTRHLEASLLRHPALRLAEAEGRLRVIDGHAGDLLASADLAAIASGTAVLEAMLAKCPAVVTYVLAPLTAWVVRRFGLIRSRWTSLPNVLADAELMPELLQEDCTAVQVAGALERRLLETVEERAAFRSRCTALHEQLRRNADACAADAVLALLGDADAGTG